jgi:ribosome-binding factor A
MRRPERVAELLREEISEIVGFELDDPRVMSVTVTEVRVASDLRDAKVFVLVDGDEKEINSALAALRHAAPYIRRQVGTALSLRHTPALFFVRDTVEERGLRIDTLLSEIKQESLVERKDEE